MLLLKKNKTIAIVVLILFLAVFLFEYLSQVSANDTYSSNCETAKTTGDYNCDNKISMSDFEDIRRDLVAGQKVMSFFEDWRRAMFVRNDPISSPTPTQQPQPTTTPTQTPTPTPQVLITPTPIDPNLAKNLIINQAIQMVSRQKITDTITSIADDDDKPGVDATQTRFSGSNGNETERDYIANNLRQLGLTVSIQPFIGTGSSGQRVSSANIVARLNGKDSTKYYLLTAHMDSTAARSGTNDPAPGADDNGSGTAVVLEAARVLSAIQNKLIHSVEFVLFSGEEQGLVGSEYYASKISSSTNILGVINMDMIGWNPTSIGDCVQFGYIARNGGNLLSDAAEYIDNSYNTNLNADSVLTNITASDHFSFVRRNIKAILVSECALMQARVGTVQPNYHSINDKPNTLLYSQIEKTAKVIVGTIIELAL